MRFRGKSIRWKIVALLLVPLVSLVGIWAFAAWITSRGVLGLLDVGQIDDRIGLPAEVAVEALSTERYAALVYLADPRASGAAAQLLSAERVTDATFGTLRANGTDPGLRSLLDAPSR